MTGSDNPLSPSRTIADRVQSPTPPLSREGGQPLPGEEEENPILRDLFRGSDRQMGVPRLQSGEGLGLQDRIQGLFPEDPMEQDSLFRHRAQRTDPRSSNVPIPRLLRQGW